MLKKRGKDFILKVNYSLRLVIRASFFVLFCLAVLLFAPYNLAMGQEESKLGVNSGEYEELEKTDIFNHDEEHHVESRDATKNIEIITSGFSRDIKTLSQTVGIGSLLDQVNKNGMLTDAETEKKHYPQATGVDYAGYIYWFINSLIIVFFILALLFYLKIIKLERVTLLIVLGFIFLLINGMFVFGSYSTIEQLKKHFKKEYIDHHLQLQGLLSDEIIELIDDMKIELEYLANIAESENFDQENYSDLLKGAYMRSKEYVYASYRIDKDNIISEMYPIDLFSLNTDISEQKYIRKARETLKPVISDIFDATEGFKGVILHYPIIKNKEYDGTVAFLINIDNFFDFISLFSDHAHLHEFFLLDSKGRIIISDKKDYVGRNIIELEEYKVANNNYKNILVSKKAGFEEYILKEKGQIITYVLIKIQDNKWVLAVNGQEKDAYLGIDDTLNSIWFFTLMALILFVVLGLLFNYFLTKSLRAEVEIKTIDIKNQSNKIKGQLKKEEETSQEKENLLEEQKRIKNVLEDKVKEMEKFQKLTVNRELKMIELKNKIRKLSG